MAPERHDPRHASRARGLLTILAVALVVAGVLTSFQYKSNNTARSSEQSRPMPQETASRQPAAPSAGPRAPPAFAAPTSPALRQTERVELASLGLAMEAPKGFEPRVSGSGIVLSPPGQLRLQTTLIALHPAGIVEDPSVYSQVTQLSNGATVKYRGVSRPEAQPPAIELQGLIEAFGASYFVSCRDAAAERALVAEWCLPFLASLQKR